MMGRFGYFICEGAFGMFVYAENFLTVVLLKTYFVRKKT